MLLILTNSDDATADYLTEAFRCSGVEFQRFDTDRTLANACFRYRVGSPELRIDGKWFRPNEITNIWYRRPEHLKHPAIPETPEGNFIIDEWGESLEAFLAHVPAASWMNHPANNVNASHKLEQLTTASRLGFEVPRTLVTQDQAELLEFYDQVNGKVIIKPLSGGYVARPGDVPDSHIYTNRVEKCQLEKLDDLAYCPTFFQEEIQKDIDVRITIVDDDIHAIELRAAEADGSQRCDIRRNNMADVIYRSGNLPPAIEKRIRALMNHYGLRFAAIDMAVKQSGDWVFFEVNPNGQWAWLDLAGVSQIATSFVHSFTKVRV